MRTQIIDELRKITKEEQILLEGNRQIDKELYQSETQKNYSRINILSILKNC